jgi:pimeloyl-ACP methyl ester carboxylesterase
LKRTSALLAVALLVTCTATAQTTTALTERPLIFVPGLLGSRLCHHKAGDPDGPTVVWGTLAAVRHFPLLVVDDGSESIVPCGLIREISFLGLYSQDLYAPFVDRLGAEGYREGETLFIFDYDWRQSVFDNAAHLAAYIDQVLPDRDTSLDIVAHSMGGLIAKIYALEHGGAERVRLFVTAGAPWHGSVKVVEALESGWGSANILVGGLADFRRTLASFPSTFELMPRYDGCCAAGGEGSSVFAAGDPKAWTALGWDGVETVHLHNLEKASMRQDTLRRIAETPLPPSVDEVALVAVDHRTPAHYQLQSGTNPAQFVVTRSWAGDGVVLRDTATVESGATFATSFSDHSGILGDADIQDFLVLAIREGSRVALQRVRPRDRTEVRTPLGVLVELIGIALEVDRPAYRPGETARLTVHIRLDTAEPFDPALLRMEVTRPGEAAGTGVALAPDPAASDPAIPLEQSFSTDVDTGQSSGYLQIHVQLDGSDGTSRVESRAVPIIDF